MAMKMNSPLFNINNFVFHYPDTKTPSIDFSKSNLGIPRGKKTFILGPSGCGKTTLLQVLGLLRDATNLAPSSIIMDGTQDYSKLTSNEKTVIRGNTFGFILQSFYLLPNFRVLENIAMPLILNGMHREVACNHARGKIKDSGLCGSDENDLNKVLHHTSDKLSQGQKQRVAILRSLIHDPQVIFADELTSNLDPSTTRKTFELLNRWQGEKEDRSILMITHDIQTAIRHADYFVVMDSNHQLAMAFPKEEFAENKDQLFNTMDLENNYA
jgi:ABC-type lipoprotein export system ATPase subunit